MRRGAHPPTHPCARIRAEVKKTSNCTLSIAIAVIIIIIIIITTNSFVCIYVLIKRRVPYLVHILFVALKSHSVQSEREEDERLRDEKQRIMDELVLKYAINATKEKK